MKESSAVINVQVPVDVATFLLNEKRSDIHRIESRLKVGITLIPNPHLETPNYSITRLRHDDIGSDTQASYSMVEKPVEEKPLTAAQEQQKATRAQAVVQGVTPMKAAPVQAEVVTVQPSLFGKIISWFKSMGEEEQPKTKPAAGRQRSAQRPERGERPEGGGKRRDRSPRGERGDRNEPRGKQAQGEAKTQEPRQPRAPRPPRGAAEGKQQRGATPADNTVVEEVPVLENQVSVAALEQSDTVKPQREGGRRRGRRGGRKERETREKAAQTSAALPAHEETTGQQSFAQMDTAQTNTAPTEYIAYPDGYIQPSEYIALPTEHAPAVPAILEPNLPAVVTQTAPAAVATSLPSLLQPAPVATAATPVETRAPAAAKTPGNGQSLVQIETDPVKANSTVQVSATPAERHTPRRRRERQHEVYVENEPLVQIETQHTPQG